ncbi:uncharacterized protein F4822DRAFT_442590 [Hypoxylon trugodes]|uniref:uncharacterized protein n=1 Tax=Hypoxylon trugodes TaxID=326681 RepID=UPI00218D81D3|nr:uncharacterized protein F4822DRAFT_442590 [Hypoxylon trugodes]KAI1382521.1 hypothetical protein F4822DRAFT_442590 [Hypoxylon trugodes]
MASQDNQNPRLIKGDTVYADYNHIHLKKLCSLRGLKQPQHATEQQLLQLLLGEDSNGRHYESWERPYLKVVFTHRGLPRYDKGTPRQRIAQILRQDDEGRAFAPPPPTSLLEIFGLDNDESDYERTPQPDDSESSDSEGESDRSESQSSGIRPESSPPHSPGSSSQLRSSDVPYETIETGASETNQQSAPNDAVAGLVQECAECHLKVENISDKLQALPQYIQMAKTSNIKPLWKLVNTMSRQAGEDVNNIRIQQVQIQRLMSLTGKFVVSSF